MCFSFCWRSIFDMMVVKSFSGSSFMAAIINFRISSRQFLFVVCLTSLLFLYNSSLCFPVETMSFGTTKLFRILNTPLVLTIFYYSIPTFHMSFCGCFSFLCVLYYRYIYFGGFCFERKKSYHDELLHSCMFGGTGCRFA